jgi:hypothetical protein
MKMKMLVTSVALGLGASSALANPDPNPPTPFASSDTLREVTKDMISACGVGSQLTSTGGGSTLAGTRMNPVGSFAPHGQQQIAPQSRFLNTTECNFFNGVVPYPGESALGANAGQGLQIGLDGVGVFHDSTEFSECRVLRYAGCMNVQDFNAKGNDANRDGDCNDPGDTPGLCYGLGAVGVDDGTGALLGAAGNAAIPLVGGQYCFTHWADALRIIYTGQHSHITDSSAGAACALNPPSASALASKRCNSDVRWTLVSQWANIFDTSGDDGAGGCADGNCPNGLSHAFRRDDFSGTTDVFLAVIGAPSISTGTALFSVRTFCNGLEGEDLDPVRRPCDVNSNTSVERDSACGTSPMRARKLPFDAATGDPSGLHSGVCSNNAALLCALNSTCGTGNTCIIGACSNNSSQPCSADAQCGAGNTCRSAINNAEGTCSNNGAQRCSVNADCGAGNTCNIFGDLGLVLAASLPQDTISQPNSPTVPLKDPASARCSVTVATACAQNSDCPAGETCNGPDYNPQYDDNIFCSTSSLNTPVKLAPMPSTTNLVFQRCPNGNARVGNRCFWPIRQNNLAGQSAAKNGWYNCKARRNNRPNGSQWPNFDARAYNRVPRHPISGEILQPVFVTNPAPDFRFIGGGDFRMHMTTPKTTLAGHPSCRQTDATRQLGCLIQADICSIAYAGLEAEDQDTTEEEIAVAGTNSPFALRSQVDVAGTCSNNPALSCNLDLDCGAPASGFVCRNSATMENGEVNAGDDLEILPTITTIRRLTHANEASCSVGGTVPTDYDARYPLARLLWVNASKGFGSGFPNFDKVKNLVDSDPDFSQVDPTVINGAQVPDGNPDLLTSENALLRCFANFRNTTLPVAIDLDRDPITPVETTTLDEVLEEHGFVTLPPSNVYPDSNRLKSCP